MIVRYHAAANLFPEMSAEEYAGLLSSIKKYGQEEPVTCWKGQVIDGRHRIKACDEAGIDWEWWDLDDGRDPFEYALQRNLHRRHLTESQRAMVAAKLVTTQKGGDRKSENQSADMRFDRTVDEAAEQMSVSPRSVDNAKAVVKNGTPALVSAVEQGKMPVTKAAKIAKQPKKEQAKAVKEAKTPAAKKAPKTNLEKARLFTSQIRQHHGHAVRLVDELSSLCNHRLREDAIRDFHNGIKKVEKILKDYERSQKA